MEALARRNKRLTVILVIIMAVFLTGISLILAIILGYPLEVGGLIAAGAFGYSLIAFLSSSRTSMRISRAKKIEFKDNPQIYRLVENLAITAGIPTPEIYLINDQAANAFATGISPQKAKIAVTSGLLEILDENELQGVLAHEISHVANYDIRLSCLIFSLLLTAGLVVEITFYSGLSGGRDRDRGGGSNALFWLVGFLAIIALFILMKFTSLAISRQREHLADTTGCQLTRYPEGLARALEKIEERGSILQRSNPAMAHLFFSDGRAKTGFWQKLFSTHPPTAERVSRIRSLTERGL